MGTLEFSGTGKVCWKYYFRVFHEEHKDQEFGSFVCLLLEYLLLRWDSNFVIQIWPWSGLPRNCNGKQFVILKLPKLILGSTQPPVQWVNGSFSLGIEWPWGEDNHWCPSSTKIQNALSFTGTLPNDYGVVHRDCTESSEI